MNPSFVNIHSHNSADVNEISVYNLDLRKDIDKQMHKFSSAGLHPWFLNEISDLSIIKKLVLDKRIIAIGEIGLDKVCETDFKLQKEILTKQLSIAEKYKKPVIIHCVKAYSDFQEIIKKYHIPFIFHSYNSSLQTAESLLNNGACLSFGKHLFTSKKLQNVLKNIDLNKVFFETDDSDILISDIYFFASDLLKIELKTLKKIIESNFKRVFLDNIK